MNVPCPTDMPSITNKIDKTTYMLPKEVTVFEKDGVCNLNAIWNETVSDQHVYIG